MNYRIHDISMAEAVRQGIQKLKTSEDRNLYASLVKEHTEFGSAVTARNTRKKSVKNCDPFGSIPAAYDR